MQELNFIKANKRYLPLAFKLAHKYKDVDEALVDLEKMMEFLRIQGYNTENVLDIVVDPKIQYGVCEEVHGGYTLRINPNYLNNVVLIHELSHAAAYTKECWHSSEFCKVLLALTSTFIDLDSFLLLKSLFKHYGVNYL